MSRRWTTMDREVLRRMWSTGKRVEDIAKALGRTPNSVRLAVHRMGLPLRKLMLNSQRTILEVRLSRAERDALAAAASRRRLTMAALTRLALARTIGPKFGASA